MGYRTYHTLQIKNVRPEDEDALIQEMDDIGIIGCALEGSLYRYDEDCVEFSGDEAVTWYDCEEDMIKLSKKFPQMIFKLYGEGEDAQDLWNEYFQNGESETCVAEIHWPDPAQIPWD